MFNLILLLAAAALVSLQTASGALLTNKIDTDNNLQPHVVPASRRPIRKYVKITTPPPETVRLYPGQRLVLECEVMGSPSPAVSWLKNGEPIVDYEEEANEILAVNPSSLARMTAKLVLNGASDGDVYTCLATAGVKQDSSATTVLIDEGQDTDIILEKLLSPPKPIITAAYNEVFQNSGTNIVLPCRVAGKADVYWKDTSDNLLYNNARYRVLPSGDLLIQSVRWSDMGQYTCEAQNEFGKDFVSTFFYPLKA